MATRHRHWYSEFVVRRGRRVVARFWWYGDRRWNSPRPRRCRSVSPLGGRCMWESGHPGARHFTFIHEGWKPKPRKPKPARRVQKSRRSLGGKVEP